MWLRYMKLKESKACRFYFGKGRVFALWFNVLWLKDMWCGKYNTKIWNWKCRDVCVYAYPIQKRHLLPIFYADVMVGNGKKSKVDESCLMIKELLFFLVRWQTVFLVFPNNFIQPLRLEHLIVLLVGSVPFSFSYFETRLLWFGKFVEVYVSREDSTWFIFLWCSLPPTHKILYIWCVYMNMWYGI